MKLYKDVVKIICSFLPVYKLRDWVILSKLSIKYLCSNPCEGAEKILEDNFDKIDWEDLSSNYSEYAIRLIEKNLENIYDKIDWSLIFQNPSEIAINIAKKNIDHVSSGFIFLNKSIKALPLIEQVLEKTKNIPIFLAENNSDRVLEIIEKNKNFKLDKNFFHYLCGNTNFKAISLIEKELKENPNSERIRLDYLCQNSNAVHLIENELKENPNSKKIDWEYLCLNPNAIRLIEEELRRNPNSEKIVWSCLCRNPNALHLIEEEYNRNPNSEKIHLYSLTFNPNDGAIKILEKNLEKLNSWGWKNLCSNHTSKEVICIIEEEYKKNPNSENIYWEYIFGNPNALRLIEEEIERHPEHIDWESLSTNPIIFETAYNYELHEILMQI